MQEEISASMSKVAAVDEIADLVPLWPLLHRVSCLCGSLGPIVAAVGTEYVGDDACC